MSESHRAPSGRITTNVKLKEGPQEQEGVQGATVGSDMIKELQRRGCELLAFSCLSAAVRPERMSYNRLS